MDLSTLTLKNNFTDELPADKILFNTPRQVEQSCYSYVNPQTTENPSLIIASEECGKLIGLQKEDLTSKEFLKVFTGNKLLEGSKPYAMCYGGHQFGHWAGQLGDGRAINLGEVVGIDNKIWALQLKGSGKTPYSRTADGLAVLRSSIREYLCSEAMHHLGVATTRALSLSLTGDKVLRDVLYDGHPAYEQGAVVCRMAESFIRFGNFQIFNARKDVKTLQTLLDYTIKHHFIDIKQTGKEAYLSFFQSVCDKTMEMILHWQRVGFVHGVMNTDNLSVLGLTIDYGPYGWLEDYNPNWTPNTTDFREYRYRFGNQPQIALWNLVQLANAIYPLVQEVKPFENILDNYKKDYAEKYQKMMNQKIGLQTLKEGDDKLIKTLEHNLVLTETDMTIFFRNLANITSDNSDYLNVVMEAFYKPEELQEPIIAQWNDWFEAYVNRLQEEKEFDTERVTLMNRVNPKYVLRNYMAQLAIEDAEKGDYTLLKELDQLLKNPYSEQEQYSKWFAKRPEWARTKVGCSVLSCSS